MQNKHQFFFVLGVPTLGEGGVNLVGPNSQNFPKNRFEGSPKIITQANNITWGNTITQANIKTRAYTIAQAHTITQANTIIRANTITRAHGLAP